MEPPSFHCQSCGANLHLTGLDQVSSFANSLSPSESSPGQGPQPQISGSSSSGLKVEESFVLLDDKRPGDRGTGSRAIEDSFVVLGPVSAARGPQGAPQSEENGRGAWALNVDLGSKLATLARVFEIASDETGVDHPLCVDCASQLRGEVEAQRSAVEGEIAEYSAAVGRLEGETVRPLSDAAFEAEMRQAREECERERQRAERLEAEVSKAEEEMAALAEMAEEMDALEERYWHDFNDYQLQLQAHVEEKAGMLNKINHASERLRWLKRTNVFNDAFKIWHSGPFGTISGFRLGRTPEVPVEWDEINCAWGQAVLLLHTMAQACRFNFSAYHLLPLGSRPRVVDKRGGTEKGRTYDLFGPVSKIWSMHYDKAQICYLACLKEFADFANAKDVAEGKENPFALPYDVDGDKVGSCTIKLTLNKDTRWTRALKLMLACLKKALEWLVKREARDVEEAPRLPQERRAA